jgi:hypothetical protein
MKQVYGQYMKEQTNLLIQNTQVTWFSYSDDRPDLRWMTDTSKWLINTYCSKPKQKAGTNGQFRNPDILLKTWLIRMQPKKDDTICDPPSGTAGLSGRCWWVLSWEPCDWFHDQAFVEHTHNTDMFEVLIHHASHWGNELHNRAG